MYLCHWLRISQENAQTCVVALHAVFQRPATRAQNPAKKRAVALLVRRLLSAAAVL